MSQYVSLYIACCTKEVLQQGQKLHTQDTWMDSGSSTMGQTKVLKGNMTFITTVLQDFTTDISSKCTFGGLQCLMMPGLSVMSDHTQFFACNHQADGMPQEKWVVNLVTVDK